MESAGFHAGSNFNFLGFGGDAFDYPVEDGALYVEAGAGAAALSVIEEDGAGGAADGGVEIGILEDYVGRLASQFEGNFFQVAGGGVHDEFADFGGSGEGDLIDEVVGG